MEALKLIRCRVTCMDSAKKEWNGEIITVSNSVVGTVRKYVPYNSDAPYHLEQIIISALREKKMQVFVNKPGKYGVPNKESKQSMLIALKFWTHLLMLSYRSWHKLS